ncbi:MAG: hypothetical protein A2784_02970 [Candidatus Chisholmbacteria bacterium RIFCSPHIGHO2_01_FULL_48_12]|uniref:Regulatory protein RecX n=1 Tax=Candidatus Chisholmbacteria bacterium RIFCSPHIGHO2_01_FULL_48_12 TaxID=1797589 RepID=A0A1G1VLY6_9BACT|nr:MAG: hypothetical protein A2784_02970 [Candidatus Chisholmbacteria bacterium RIFCSPHIGHO2_01_FULL_48_12]
MLRQALWFLKFRPRSEAEVRAYLAKKGGQAQDINEVVDKLKRMKFVDDEEFIKFWLRRRQARPRASWIIKLELKKLGVASELIDRVLGDQKQADRQRATQLTEKLRGKDREKVIAALTRRGFDWDTIKGVKLVS